MSVLSGKRSRRHPVVRPGPISPRLKQRMNDGTASSLRSSHEGGATVRVASIDISASLQQQFRHRRVAVVSGAVQRSPTEPSVRVVDFAAALEQKCHGTSSSTASRVEQRGEPIFRDC
jgi:hypothetical protein